MAAIRNIFMLTTLLGLGFLLGFFPVISSNSVQQYLFVLINGGAGESLNYSKLTERNVDRLFYSHFSLVQQ